MSSRDEKWKMGEERSQGVTGRWSGRVLELVFDYVEMGTLLKVFVQGKSWYKVVYEKMNLVKLCSVNWNRNWTEQFRDFHM